MSTVIGSSGTPNPEEPQDTQDIQDTQDPQDSQELDDSREGPQPPEVDGAVDVAVDPADEGELDPEEWDEPGPEPETEPGETSSHVHARAQETTAAPRAEAAAEETPAPVDDVASRAKRMRRRRRAVGSVALAVVVIGVVGAIMPFTPMMPVHGINVDGTQNLSTGEVQDLTGIEPETPMGRVDVQGAAQRVAGNPWVNSVTVKRDWPSAIDVVVDEHKPVAFVTEDDGAHLIDDEGKDFIVAEPPAGAMELVGPGISDEEGKRHAVEIAASISDKTRGEVESLEARGPYEYVLHVAGGRQVTWGAAEDNMNKALALETVLQLEGTEFNISNPELVTSR
ncbi:cell division protein FtsQ/DivIB [Corynebacterium hadale]